jgi:hypothetical protein
MVTRRTFLHQASGAAVAALTEAACARRRLGSKARRFRYLGWQVGVTYQSMAPGGLDREHFLRLLDEMAAARMNTLSLMMQSYAYFDPEHDGYAWPVRNERLRSYRDLDAINAQPDREFLREIIGSAAARGIEIQLFLNWGIWNPDFVKAAYPQCSLQTKDSGEAAGWLHCPDSPGAWQLGLDETNDMLTFYDHPNVTGYAIERIGYSGTSSCYCPYTREAFRKEVGRPLEEAAAADREAWKTMQTCRHLTAFSAQVRTIRPGISLALHTQCAPGWGHEPRRLQACGMDYLLPHTIQFPTTQKELYAMLDRLAPNLCVLHFCARDRRPQNYNLWLKTPAIIEEALGWIDRYPGENLHGILFFNEPATSPANKRAVYEGIQRFT